MVPWADSGTITSLRSSSLTRWYSRATRMPVSSPAAPAVADDLEAAGYAVHVVGDHEIQLCTTETNKDALDGFVAALRGAAR